MMHEKLINPTSIAIIGGSDDVQKPGGKVLKNLLESNFKGAVYVVNQNLDQVQGVKSYRDVLELPQTDLAIIAIAAKFCPSTVKILAKEKATRGFIILSAGFSEENEAGGKLEHEIVEIINKVGGSLIGPNCIGVLNTNYCGVFTSPIPTLNNKGCDFISGSGATALFIMEVGIPNGLTFSSVYSVGNSAQLGVEDVLKYLDETFDAEKSSHVKLLYMESIKKPEMLLKHASSLIRKGCKIAAIKAGNSEAGSRAASSHTGALANNDMVVTALLHKAGIVRCYSRQELCTVAGVFLQKELTGKNIAVVTHAGGPAVMLTDALSNGGLSVPKIEGEKANALLKKLYAGSSVANPIDFLATGTAEQLGYIIDACENDFEQINAICVIFGSSGLFGNTEAYNLLDKKMSICKKPIYPILPSIINVKKEISDFLAKGRINFPEEVVFGSALTKIYNTPKPQNAIVEQPEIDFKRIRKVIDEAENGYLSPEKVQHLLDAARIPRAKEAIAFKLADGIVKAKEIGYPIVMKVVGPLHKTDVGGVMLNIANENEFTIAFNRMIKIKDTIAILIQPMLSGIELFIGAKNENRFGHLIMFGLGGIFIEVFKDIEVALAPVSSNEAFEMINQLQSHKILDGIRGQEPIDKAKFAEIISRVSALCNAAPEIFEMDLNPLLGKKDQVVAVDARISIKK